MTLTIENYLDGNLLITNNIPVTVDIYPCEPIFKAALMANFETDAYLIEGCIGEIEVLNASVDSSRLDSLVWLVDNNQMSNDWNSAFYFNESGTYDGNLILNPGGQCTDTARIKFKISEVVVADFQYSYDPCTAGPVAFFNETTGTDPPFSYQWNFGNAATDTLPAPVAQYLTPGPFDVALAVTDANGCADTLVRAVDYRPAPAVLVVAPADTLGCPPVTIRFDNLSVPVDTTYAVRWAFGDGGTSDRISPAHTYTEVGTYDVALSIESPLGCLIDTVFRELIRIQNPPSAAFFVDEERPTNLRPTISLSALDPALPRYDWRVDGAPVADGPRTSYTLPDTGRYALALVVTDRAYCQDTVARTINVRPAATYFLPNAFTPNADGTNDFFGGTGETRYLTDFALRVFDRYGALVFLTTDPAGRWDGRLRGAPLPQGVYTWRLGYTGADGERVDEIGSVVLVR